MKGTNFDGNGRDIGIKYNKGGFMKNVSPNFHHKFKQNAILPARCKS